jgi:hypothetical protein
MYIMGQLKDSFSFLKIKIQTNHFEEKIAKIVRSGPGSDLARKFRIRPNPDLYPKQCQFQPISTLHVNEL